MSAAGWGLGPGNVREWLAKAGRIRIKEAGEQANLFGPPAKMFRVVASSGESILLSEDQLKTYNLFGIIERSTQTNLFEE